ncbi:MAG: bifunctional aminodeoxychorismate synthase component I/aminodeoxychorismate lyase [Marmoricola sp.]|nr:bifunctional aminodeoxychorismate synthase component I/aminodeoxychorismate lyase [Marmoricola sp.]
MQPHRAPGVVRRPLEDLGRPTDLLARLPRVERLVALVGSWRHGHGLVAWDPLAEAGSAFDLPLPERAPGESDAEAFGGGWVGVWGYGLAAEVEEALGGGGWTPHRPVPQPTHRIGFYDRVLRLVEGRWWFEQLTGLLPPEEEQRRAESFLATLGEARSGPARWEGPGFATGPFAMIPSPDEHVAGVAEVVRRIAAGEVFQVNLTARLEASFSGDPLALFCRGVEALAPAYAAFVEDADGAVASLSPELFLRRQGRDVVSSPIKGTAPLSVDPGRLVGSGKDRAENVMIVDLVRNDLGRVAAPGSVEVRAVNRLERHAVWHLVSDVAARLADGVRDGDLLRATFPPGSVTGAPKIAATEVIGELEATGREAYTGAVGHVGPHAGLELNVAIRTFEIAAGRVWLGVGGGIVHDSDPRAELAECFTKALPLLDALGARLAPDLARVAVPRRPRHDDGPGAAVEVPRAVFETLLVVDGVLVDAAPHLARLAASVDALWGRGVVGVAELLVGHAAGLAGRHRLRLDVDVDPAGEVRTSVLSSPLGPTPPSSTLVPLVVEGGLGCHKWSDRPEVDATLPVDRDQLVLDVDGAVLETGRAALLVVVDDEVCAPVLDGRQLPSTGRERVRVLLERVGLPLVERVLTRDDLTRASEVMTVNALRSVVPVTGVDGVGSWGVGPVATWLRTELGGEPGDGVRGVRPGGGPRPRGSVTPRRSRRAAGARVLFVDNQDSFVHNLVQHATAAGARVEVVRNDALPVEALEQLCRDTHVTHVVVSPGPGTPEDAGVSVEVVRRLGSTTPVLGVCLGHQAIALAYGGRVVRAPRPSHGKPCLVRHDGSGVLAGLEDPLVVGRYHSLVVEEATLPADLVVTARSPSGLVMGLRHRRHPVEGVQWHPESVLTPAGGDVLTRFLGRARPVGGAVPGPSV